MVNKVTLIGNLGRDPEVRRLESGAVVAKFSVATNENYKDRNDTDEMVIVASGWVMFLRYRQNLCQWMGCWMVTGDIGRSSCAPTENTSTTSKINMADLC